MLPSSIRASVSPDTINRVGRLFNNTLPDVINELLQNARRAGATRVDVALTRNDRAKLSITDDGIGIADPATVLTLGESRWNDDIAAREDPAGMGVFSLAGHDVLVTSRHETHDRAWTALIPREAWDGSQNVAVIPSDHPIGTTLTITLPEAWDDHVDRVVAAAALHYPVAVFFNGAECPRERWLDKAIHTSNWHGCTIGVFAGSNRYHDHILNFHGVTVPCKLPTIAEVQGGNSYYARIDIHDCPALQLVLPARKEAVENEGLSNLREAVERTLYEAIALQPRHSLGFQSWTRAHELGVVLSEAAPQLRSWHPATADSASGSEQSALIPAIDVICVERDEPEVEQSIAAALRASPLRAQMVEEEPAFAGYGWYDKVSRMEHFRFEVAHQAGSLTIAEAMTTIPLSGHLEASRIVMKADLRDGDRIYPIACETDVALVTDGEVWSDLDAARIVYRKTLAVDDLADLLESAYFRACDDCDSDSWETQHRYFRSEARELALKLLCGADEAVCDRFRSLLQDNRWLLPKDAALHLMMEGDAISVRLDRPVGAAS